MELRSSNSGNAKQAVPGGAPKLQHASSVGAVKLAAHEWAKTLKSY